MTSVWSPPPPPPFPLPKLKLILDRIIDPDRPPPQDALGRVVAAMEHYSATRMLGESEQPLFAAACKALCRVSHASNQIRTPDYIHRLASIFFFWAKIEQNPGLKTPEDNPRVTVSKLHSIWVHTPDWNRQVIV